MNALLSTTTDAPVVSKYAAKKQNRQEPVLVTRELVKEPTFEEKAVAIDLFAGFEEALLGEANADLERMTELRTKAYDLIAKAKSMDMAALEKKCTREAYDWREQEPKDAERQLWNQLSDAHKTDGKLEIYRKAFLDLQAAFHSRDGDEAKKAKFNELRMSIVNKVPRMAKIHVQNLERAEAALEHLNKARDAQEALWTKARDNFEEANIIATLHGWPVTEAKKK